MSVIEREAEIEDAIRASIIDTCGLMPGLDVIARRIRRDLMAKYPALSTDTQGAVEERDRYKRLYEQRGKDAADAEDQLAGAVQERDEAVALLHKAAHRLVPVPPYQEIADWLTRYEGGAVRMCALVAEGVTSESQHPPDPALQRASDGSGAYPAHMRESRADGAPASVEAQTPLTAAPGPNAPIAGASDAPGQSESPGSHENPAGVTSGSHICGASCRCVCTSSCEWPCWQRIGLTADACCPGCAPLDPIDTAGPA